MKLESFISSGTLNIFCDASTGSNTSRGKGSRSNIPTCGGVIAISGGRIIDEIYHFSEHNSCAGAETDAFITGCELGLEHIDYFDHINIFTDNQSAISGIKNWMGHIEFHRNDKLPYDYLSQAINGNKYVSTALALSENIPKQKISIYHQKGHIRHWANSDLQKAAHVFAASNGIRSNIDISLIRYISRWNNYIDDTSRKVLYYIRQSPLIWNHMLEFRLTRRDEIRWILPIIQEAHENMHLG